MNNMSHHFGRNWALPCNAPPLICLLPSLLGRSRADSLEYFTITYASHLSLRLSSDVTLYGVLFWAIVTVVGTNFVLQVEPTIQTIFEQ